MVNDTLPGPLAIRNLVATDPDLLRGLVEQAVAALVSADPRAACDAD